MILVGSEDQVRKEHQLFVQEFLLHAVPYRP